MLIKKKKKKKNHVSCYFVNILSSNGNEEVEEDTVVHLFKRNFFQISIYNCD